MRSYLRGRIYLIQEKPELATREADLILRTPESELQISDLRDAGILYARAGQTSKARLALLRLNKAWKAGPSSWKLSSLKNLEGEIFLAEKRPEEAQTAFLAADPRARSHVGLARAYQVLQREDAAVEEWKKVLDERGAILRYGFPPDLFIAHLELARAYRTLRDWHHALSEYQELIRLLQNADGAPIFQQAKREAGQFVSEASPGKNLSEDKPRAGVHYRILSTRRTLWICCSSSETRLQTNNSGSNSLKTPMEQSNDTVFA